MTPPPKKRQPLQAPIKWSDEELDHLSEISKSDLVQAQGLWKRDVPVPLKELLEAEVIEDQNNG